MTGKKRSEINPEVAHRIKGARIAKKLSQRQLSRKLNNYGIERSVATIRGYENQRIAPPDSVLEAIAKACDVDFFWIKGYNDPFEIASTKLAGSLHQKISNMNSWNARTITAINNVFASYPDLPVEYVTAFKKYNAYQKGLEEVVKKYMQGFFKKEVQYDEEEVLDINYVNRNFVRLSTNNDVHLYLMFSCEEDLEEYQRLRLEEYKNGSGLSIVRQRKDMGKGGLGLSFDAEAERVGLYTFVDDETYGRYYEDPSKRASIINDYRKEKRLPPIPIEKIDMRNNNED